MKIHGIPVVIKINLLLYLLVSLFLSVFAGWLLSLGALGKHVAKTVLFPAGIFYLQLLFLFSLPLLSTALIRRVADISREWNCCEISGRLYMFWSTTVAGAALLGILGGSHLSFAGPVFGLEPQYLEEVIFFRKFLPGVVILSALFGFALTAMRQETEIISQVMASLFQSLERTGNLLLKFMPAGVFLLLAPVFSFTGYASIWFGIKLLLVMFACCVAYSFLIYGYSLRRCGKNCPGHFWAFFRQVVLAGFAGGTLADCANCAVLNLQRLGVGEARKNLLFISGMHWGAAGTALYCSLTVMAAMQWSGSNVSLERVTLTFFFSILLSLLTFDFVGGGLYRLLFLLLFLDVPFTGLFPILVVERFLDGIRMGENVIGAGTGIYLADKLRW